MVASLERKRCAEPIAEFPFSQRWNSIQEFLEALDRAGNLRFIADDQQSFVLFEYVGYGFCLCSDEAAILLSVDEAGCPEAIQDELFLRLSRFFRFWLNH